MTPAFNFERYPSTQQQLAEKLFVREEFAMTKFRDMELEDWQLHSTRAWEIAGIFIKEMKRQKKNTNHKRVNQSTI